MLDAYITAAISGVQNRKFNVYHLAFGIWPTNTPDDVRAEEEGKKPRPHMQEMNDWPERKIKVIFYQEEIDSDSRSLARRWRRNHSVGAAGRGHVATKRMADLMGEHREPASDPAP
jgi:hypothetical protein